MNPNTLRFLSMAGILMTLGLSGTYFYKTWMSGEPRWYFLILAFSIALMLSFNLFGKRKR